MNFLSQTTDFFDKNPALFYGIGFFLGAEAAVNQNLAILLPLICLLLCKIRFAWLTALVIISGFCYTSANYSYVAIHDEGVLGFANIKIEGIALVKSRFGEHWQYKGILRSFTPQDGGLLLKNIPVSFRIKNNAKIQRPLADSNYLIPCKLFPTTDNRYNIQLDFNKKWYKGKASLNLAEFRYFAKNKVKMFIQSHFSKKNSQEFLSGLVTGEFNQEKIKTAFARFGLLHLMAISGFHFSLFASILIFLFRPFFNPYKVTALTAFALTVYFVFLGSGPSILRAWTMAIVCFGTLLSKRPINSKNALGCALILTLLIDPSLCNHIGFRFSFLITAAILFGIKPVEKLLLKYFPKKEIGSFGNFTIMEKHFLLLLNFFRPIVALNLVTTAAALPLSLYYFEQFPLLSFIYNLFFPLLVTVSLFLLVLGMALYPIPFISNGINSINDHFTNFILNMTMDVPKKLDIYLKFSDISPKFLILFYTIFFTVLINFYYKYNKNNQLLNHHPSKKNLF